MNETEREQLARRLSAMTLKDARKEVMKLDRDADLKFFRNAIRGKYHTLFTLPNAELSITLVETATIEESSKPDHTGPRGRKKRQETEFNYREARVEPLERPAFKHGGEDRKQLR